jgi:hypothetical protein
LSEGINQSLLIFWRRVRVDCDGHVKGFAQRPILTHRLRLNCFPLGLILRGDVESRQCHNDGYENTSYQHAVGAKTLHDYCASQRRGRVTQFTAASYCQK